MNVLIITAHVRDSSFVQAMGEAYATGARDAGCTVQLLTLARLRFDPDVHTVSPNQQPLEPDLQQALQALEWADHWVIVFPAWWGTGPARMKGFFDRVLLPGRAFHERADGRLEGLMKHRTAHVITTLDMPPWVYRFVYRAPGHTALRRSVLGVCGVRCSRCLAVGPLNHSDVVQRATWLVRAQAMGRSLSEGPLAWQQRTWNAFKGWLRALRLQFYPMSWVGYTVGALAATQGTGSWNSAAYWLGYASLFMLKAATVFSNEIHDLPTDSVNCQAGPFNGGSRVLVDRMLTVQQLRIAFWVLLLGSLLFAGFGLQQQGVDVAAGITWVAVAVAALSYTAPPIKLCWRGLGEVDVAVTHSLGVLLWGYVMQAGQWDDGLPWSMSLPMGLSILPAIVLSSLPDREADATAGKRSLAVRLGRDVATAIAGTAAVAANLAAFVVDREGWAPGSFVAVLPFTTVHLALLLALLYARPARLRGDAASIICALTYLVWFIVAPLWHAW